MNLNDTVSINGISKTTESEISILRHEINEQHKCLSQYQLILGCIKDVIHKKTTISATTSRKVEKIIFTEQAAQFFQNCPMDSNPLGLLNGIASSKDFELLYDETAQLQTAVEESISEKCNAIKSNEENSSAKSRYGLNVDKSNLLKLNTELDKALNKYNESLLEGCRLLKEICDCVVPMAKISGSQASFLLDELQLTEQKAKYMQFQITSRMYSEGKHMVASIDQIDTSLKLEMESVSLEIKKLRALKGKYDQMSEMEEYCKIVKEYKDTKKCIQDKTWLLKQC